MRVRACMSVAAASTVAIASYTGLASFPGFYAIKPGNEASTVRVYDVSAAPVLVLPVLPAQPIVSRSQTLTQRGESLVNCPCIHESFWACTPIGVH